MKIYLVYKSWYDKVSQTTEKVLLGIFSSREKAEKFAKSVKIEDPTWEEVYIHEIVVEL